MNIFYYDPAGQYRGGEALAKNQIIIDIRFVKTEVIGEDADVSTTTLHSMGSLADVRDRYTPTSESGAESTVVGVVFRYVKYQPSPSKPEITYIGRFGTTTSDPDYMLIFSNK
ncbi:MAG: hypothetical protein LBV43_03505 [Prevotella sp.]|nr:hypothetical protein [Prevotella sp.]